MVRDLGSIKLSEAGCKRALATDNHVPIMVDGRRAEDEARHVRSDLLPRIVFHYLSFTGNGCCFGIIRCPFFR